MYQPNIWGKCSNNSPLSLPSYETFPSLELNHSYQDTNLLQFFLSKTKLLMILLLRMPQSNLFVSIYSKDSWKSCINLLFPSPVLTFFFGAHSNQVFTHTISSKWLLLRWPIGLYSAKVNDWLSFLMFLDLLAAFVRRPRSPLGTKVSLSLGSLLPCRLPLFSLFYQFFSTLLFSWCWRASGLSPYSFSLFTLTS